MRAFIIPASMLEPALVESEPSTQLPAPLTSMALDHSTPTALHAAFSSLAAPTEQSITSPAPPQRRQADLSRPSPERPAFTIRIFTPDTEPSGRIAARL